MRDHVNEDLQVVYGHLFIHILKTQTNLDRWALDGLQYNTRDVRIRTLKRKKTMKAKEEVKKPSIPTFVTLSHYDYI